VEGWYDRVRGNDSDRAINGTREER
jgi:hypothetical protein